MSCHGNDPSPPPPPPRPRCTSLCCWSTSQRRSFDVSHFVCWSCTTSHLHRHLTCLQDLLRVTPVGMTLTVSSQHMLGSLHMCMCVHGVSPWMHIFYSTSTAVNEVLLFVLFVLCHQTRYSVDLLIEMYIFSISDSCNCGQV